SFGGPKEDWREAERLLLAVLKELRLDDPDPGVDVWSDFSFPPLRQEAVRAHGKVARPIDAGGADGGGDKQRDVRRLGIPDRRQASKIRPRPLEPECVGVADEEWRGADERRRFLDAAALIEQPLTFVGDDDLRPSATFQMRFDLTREI